MWPNPVVPMYQEMTDIASGFFNRSVAQSRYSFAFQTAEYAFHWRVIPAVSAATHALLHPITPQPLVKYRGESTSKTCSQS
jgi:hypothetical protein